MLFFVRDGRKSKQMWGYFPSATDGKKACRRYFPSVRTEICVLQALFSVPRNGRLSKREAIFRPPLTKRRLYDVIFPPLWTSEDFDWWKMTHNFSVVTVSHWPRSVGFSWVLLKNPRFRSVLVFWPAQKPVADV